MPALPKRIQELLNHSRRSRTSLPRLARCHGEFTLRFHPGADTAVMAAVIELSTSKNDMGPSAPFFVRGQGKWPGRSHLALI